jgi:hypothetical protein
MIRDDDREGHDFSGGAVVSYEALGSGPLGGQEGSGPVGGLTEVG